LKKDKNYFYEGKFLALLAIFPEVTTTCGRNILKFKKGIFYGLLQIKPVIINHYQESKYHLSKGTRAAFMNYIEKFCHFIESLYIKEMPIIKPIEFILEKNI